MKRNLSLLLILWATVAHLCLAQFFGGGEDVPPEDPCATLACGANAECVHDLDGYNCKCKKGFDGDGFTCVDIDECSPNRNPCDPHATCVNLEGSFVCSCDEGYQGDGFMCTYGKQGVFSPLVEEPKPEEIIDDGTQGLALELRGGDKLTIDQLEARGYVDPGWIVKRRGGGLVEAEVFYDIPAEMTAGIVGNYVLEYRAMDKHGHEADPQYRTVTVIDIDECKLGLHDCSVHADCVNTINSYECRCKPGFVGSGTKCTDIDECRLGTHNCHPKANCTNIPGSFKCACIEGYEGDGLYCVDVDECARGTHKCDEHATCINTDGGYECECSPGFEGNGYVCNPVNSCEHGTHDCHVWATCTKTDEEPEGYRCECKRGFKGDGRHCEDVDECAHPSLFSCPVHSHCVNVVGSYDCECDEGFEKGDDDYSCVDIDECARETDNCDSHANCTNTVGGFYCTCKEGFIGNGFTCRPPEGTTDITLRGPNPKNISQCDPYLEEGFILSDVKREKLRVSVSLPPALMEDPVQQPGTFIIQYNVRDEANHSVVTRTVNVLPVNPCILPEGHRCRHKCHVFAQCVFTDPGYKCVCRDGYENQISPEGEIYCKDNVPPVIELKGENPTLLRACKVCKWYDPGENYDEHAHGGYYAYDELPDGQKLDLTDRVVVTNKSIGTNAWEITYDVQDLAGNPAPTQVRIVRKEVEDVFSRIDNMEKFLQQKFVEFEPYPQVIDRFTTVATWAFRILAVLVSVLLLVYFVPRVLTFIRVATSSTPPSFEDYASGYDLFYSLTRPHWSRQHRQRMISIEYQRKYRDNY